MSSEPMNRSVSTAPRSSRWRSVAEVLPYAIGGGVVGALAVSVGERFGGSMPSLHLSTSQSALLLMVSCMALIGTIVVHELGHLLGGRLVGFRAFLLIVGPLRLERSASGWRFAMNRSIALAGGLAGTAPTDTHRVRQRMAVVIAGGPLSSLITGVLALAWCLSLRPSEFDIATPFGRVLFAASLAAYGFGSVGIGLLTLIPGRTAGFRTDGAQLLTFLRGGA
ncbi:MAG: M50 family metallopeptidase, partial [Gemmatimonadaceae bacterium]|nr:M50 family metallopeptidase [Gemmatimonadaceae bacterium]